MSRSALLTRGLCPSSCLSVQLTNNAHNAFRLRPGGIVARGPAAGTRGAGESGGGIAGAAIGALWAWLALGTGVANQAHCKRAAEVVAGRLRAAAAGMLQPRPTLPLQQPGLSPCLCLVLLCNLLLEGPDAWLLLTIAPGLARGRVGRPGGAAHTLVPDSGNRGLALGARQAGVHIAHTRVAIASGTGYARAGGRRRPAQHGSLEWQA